ncbi:hypothetical protein I8R13_19535 [Acinetobacter baumannii]|nr:hypothetical protein [Acinetobacter baumannii]
MIFDVAIEVFLFDQKEPYLVILIECKNYEKNVPVDDIEEFSTKVSQVGKALLHKDLKVKTSHIYSNLSDNSGMWSA